MKAGLQLLATVHRVTQIAEEIFDEAVRRERITARQAQVLAAIRDCEGASQTDIAEATAIDRSTLADICRRLIAKGLISRRRSREDSRAYVLKVTPEGHAVLRRVEDATDHAARQVRKRIIGLEHLRVAAPIAAE